VILAALVLLLGLHTGPEPCHWAARPHLAAQIDHWRGAIDGFDVSLTCPF
jgi:hypothetical protein